jgi:hypothetical protein
MLAVGASSASASQTFGSDLTPAASATPGNCDMTGCTTLVASFRTGNANPSTAPISGVVVSFGIKVSAADAGTFVIGRSDGSGNGAVTATGPPANLAAAGTYSVPARTPVTAGDQLGFTYALAGDYTIPSTCGSGGGTWLYHPALVQGNSPQAFFQSGGCDRLINATVEADADHDGYGDETQDQCPTDASTQGPCPTGTATQPATTTTTPTPRRKCKKHHRSLSASAAKKHCKKHKK